MTCLCTGAPPCWVCAPPDAQKPAKERRTNRCSTGSLGAPGGLKVAQIDSQEDE